MSLEQVNNFYETLTANQALYEQYHAKCSNRGMFGIWDWNKTKIVDFAASFGYQFTEAELEQVWFEGDNSVSREAVYTAEHAILPKKNSKRKKVKNILHLLAH
jgi:Nif11 domain